MIHHIQPVSVITDIPLSVIENENLIGQGSSAPVSRDGHYAEWNPPSAILP